MKKKIFLGSIILFIVSPMLGSLVLDLHSLGEYRFIVSMIISIVIPLVILKKIFIPVLHNDRRRHESK